MIVDALRGRLLQVCEEAKSIQPDAFGEAMDDVARMKEALVHGKFELKLPPPSEWLMTGDDCLTCLRRLSVGETLPTTSAVQPADNVLSLLRSTRKDPHAQFNLLRNYYAYPPNFALPSENDIREYVLARVMVSHRSRVEVGVAVDNAELFLCLNLLAINALFTSDLRYIDALNYFYELIPAPVQSLSDLSWLQVSYLVLYANALVASIERVEVMRDTGKE